MPLLRELCFLGLALGSMSVAGCTSTEPLDANGRRPPNLVDPTYTRDIEPLLQQSCQSCHHDGGLAPMALDTYATSKLFGAAIVRETAARKMPPWGAFSTSECQPTHAFKEDPSLSADDLAMLAKWVETGAPEGDVDDAPPKVMSFASPALARPDKTLTVEKGWAARGAKDQFRCFVLDPEAGIPLFVQGVGFRAGTPSVVHHAIVFTDPQRESLAKVGPDGSYECFGSPEVSETQILYAWAPGTEPTDLGPRAGYYLAANSLLVLQIHYHPQGDDTPEDKSAIDLKWSVDLPEYAAYLFLFGNFSRLERDGDGLQKGMNDRDPARAEFRIPANVAGHVETMKLKVPDRAGDIVIPEARAIIVGSHMHYVGTDLKLTVHREQTLPSESKDECLVQTPQWDFNWQRTYRYDTEIEQAPRIKAGDTLEARCTYDNTMNNPALVRALREQNKEAPIDVSLGEQTLDEMCLGVLVAAFPNPLL